MREDAYSVDVDDLGPVGRAFIGTGPFARRVDRLVFEEDDGVGARAHCDVMMDGALEGEALEVRHGVGA